MGVLSKAAASAHGAIEHISDAAAPTSKWLEEQRETLGTTGDKLVESTCKYVAAHPLQSLGLALAAGFLISRLTSRLSR
jgi:ElaB/YqjD/DUF883 family membrane-anchored ribosome-binding protein